MTGAAPGALAGLARLTPAHNARMTALDPLLPTETAPRPAPPPDGPPPRFGVVTQDVITVPGAGGVVQSYTGDPDTLESCWAALRQYQLTGIRVSDQEGPGAVTALDDLLSRWQTHVSQQPPGDGGESAAALTWASRDTEVARLFLGRGLSPRVIVAVRTAGRAGPPVTVPDGLVIRPLAGADVDAAGRLQEAVVAWDAQFGGVHMRPSTPARARAEVARQVGAEPVTSWVAEQAGQVTGYVSIEWPAQAGWISSRTAADPARVAYLGCMSVLPGRRSGGTGAALAAFVHAQLDLAGIQATLLHYGANNPLSAPFWARSGYRPLWTSWQVSPHTRLGQ
jgi:predicted N-acetyltransferase YhbS